MKTILVTGIAGFIGHHIARRLLIEGYRVIGIDNFLTGTRENVDAITDGLDLTKRAMLHFIEGDIRNHSDLSKCFDVYNVDAVTHQAALGSVPRSIQNPGLTMEMNVTGTLKLLEAMRDYNVKRLVYASSSSVYGETVNPIKREDELYSDQISPYAASKRMVEIQCSTWNKCYGINTTGLRYFNVFGPRQSTAAAIPRFIECIKQRSSMTVYGNGLQARDWTYIDNVVQANMAALTTTNSASQNNIMNIGCGEQASVFSVLTELQQLGVKFGYAAPEVNYTNARQGDVKNSQASIERARRLLGYTPEVKWKEGLRKTCEWAFSESAQWAKPSLIGLNQTHPTM